MCSKEKKRGLITIVIILGILSLYIMQMGPSPILGYIRKDLNLENEVLANMVVNIVFFFIVVGCLCGGYLEKKMGTKNLYSLALFLGGVGVVSHLLCAHNYVLLLAGRSIFGFGFGLAVPFIGSAIMKWYDAEEREKMDTVNAMFPFVGTAIGFIFMVPVCNLFKGHWEYSLAIWCLPMFLCLIVWAFYIKDRDFKNFEEEKEEDDENIYRDILRRKDLRLLGYTFICDFACYSYIGVILPTFFSEIGNINEALANIVAAVAFPAFGFFGSIVGGKVTSLTGKRKPILCIGQMGKFIGLLIACLLYKQGFAFIITGIAMFGFFNGFWMPVMYCVPMDLENMSAAKVGLTFALITSCGIAAGFFAPSVGGALTQVFMESSGIRDAVLCHADALRRSLLIFSFTNVIGLFCCMAIKETGKS